MSNVFLIPLFAYVLWVSIIYFLLTIMRAPTIWGAGEDSVEAKRYAIMEPRASANLSNQFEWPVLFFAVSIILIARPELYDVTQLWLAWVFVLGRIIHSVVHIFTNNIKLRGMVFNINFLAVLGMWGVLALNVFSQ
jgi:hypothetical protein